MSAWIAGTFLGPVFAGCVPFAWVNPPLQAGVGIGAGLGNLPRTVPPTTTAPASPRPAPETGAHLAYSLRVSANPFQAIPGLMDRPFDVGVGVLVRPPVVDVTLWGPYLELSWILFAQGDGAESEWASLGSWDALRPFPGARPCAPGGVCQRVNAHLQAGPVFAADPYLPVGVRTSFQLSVEWVRFAHGTFAGGFGAGGAGGVYALGAGHGESSFGLYAEVARYSIAGTVAWDITFGLMMRLPASVGVGLACCMR